VKTLLDVVNFNADASCLPVDRWMSALEGGEGSELHRWLASYVQAHKKVSLGLIGATVAEIAQLNPEALALINAHPDIFEILLRPFAHDIALLRDAVSFSLNVQLGKQTLARELPAVMPYFLPPEFMLTNEQISLLGDLGVEGVFINSGRFRQQIARRIPTVPYRVEGVLGSKLACLPLADSLTRGYLDSLHAWSANAWNNALAGQQHDLAMSWRDGESWLLFPDGLAREQAWLAGESAVTRVHVRDVLQGRSLAERTSDPALWWSYPVHSFFEWVKEFRMFGYLRALRDAEQRLASLSPDEIVLWLCAAGSDVLSAVEKDDPVVQLWPREGDTPVSYAIVRSPRGYEGEEYLALLQRWTDPRARAFLDASTAPHLVRLKLRQRYVRDLSSSGTKNAAS
jgi:hypothetical protein